MYVVILNKICEWSEPSQTTTTRMFLTRSAAFACALFEVAAIGETIYKGITTIFSNSTCKLEECKLSLFKIAKLTVGIASTVLLGIAFSPAINYRIHVALGLVEYDLNLSKQRQAMANAHQQLKQEETKAADAMFLANLQGVD